MKTNLEKKMWNGAAFLIMILIISLPFYSAQALSVPSIQITKNSGEDNIDKFLNGNGDTWTVEASVNDPRNTSIDPEKIKVRIGSHEAPFNSCTENALGSSCKYVSPLVDGVREGEYTFDVIYSYLNELGVLDSTSNTDVIKVDASAPKISGLSVSQHKDDGLVYIDFTVDDKVFPDAPAVGLKKIDIIDADTDTVLQTIDNLEGKIKFNYRRDTSYEGKLQYSFTGEGRKRIKILAEDSLGHSRTSNAVAFMTDFVKPDILTETLNFTQLGKFMGPYMVDSPLTLDVKETSDLRVGEAGVVAYSEPTSLNGDKADCARDETEDTLWHCRWANVEINPALITGNYLSVRIIAKDAYGNSAEESQSVSFVTDTSIPERLYYGSENQFEGKSYVKSGNNRIILRVKKQGAEITREGIEANLVSVGGSANQIPDSDHCSYSENIFECYWDVSKSLSASNVKIGLTKLEDSIGNQGDKSEVQLEVDNSGPLIEKLEIFGSSSAGDKLYFQSNDKIKIKFTAKEEHGLKIFAGLKNLVDGAEVKYPLTSLTRDLGEGWRVYTEEDNVCQRTANEGEWACELETDEIRSGYDSSVSLQLRIRDTAGNDARDALAWSEKPSTMLRGIKGDYYLELLGLSTEEKPDYWQVAKNGVNTITSNSFIDMDTTELAEPRMAFTVKLTANKSDVKLRKVELVNCENNLPDESKGRQVVWNNIYTDPQSTPAQFNLVLGFQPFNSKEYFKNEIANTPNFQRGYINHTCHVKLYSQVGREALNAPEIQSFNVAVPFGFTSLGSADVNLDQRIKDAKKDVTEGFWGLLEKLNLVLKILNYLMRLVQIILDVMGLYHAFQAGFGAMTTGTETIPVSGEMSTLERIGFCMGNNVGEYAVGKSIDWIQIPIQVLTCKKTFCDASTVWSDRSLPGKIACAVTGFYNMYAGKLEGLTFQLKSADESTTEKIPEVTSVYDNLYLSAASFCIPGIIFNLEKYRQIKCRYIDCLESDVAAGVATIDACGKLEDVMQCKYVLGPLFQLIPFVGLADTISKAVKSLFLDPVGWVPALLIGGCAINCLSPVRGVPDRLTLSATCVKIHWWIKLVKIADDVWAGIQDISAETSKTGADYCAKVT